MQERADPRPHESGRLVQLAAPGFAFLAAGVLVGVVIAALAVFDRRPVAGTSVVWVLGYPLAVLAHASMGALVMGGILDWRPGTNLVRPVTRYLLTVLVAVFVLLVVVVDSRVLGVTSATAASVVYLAVMAVATAVGALGAYAIVSPGLLKGRGHEALAVRLLAAFGGLAAGAIAVIVLVVGLAVYRHATLPDAAITIPPIAVATGRYVALGDSYSAGEGLEPFDAGTESGSGDGCHRSRLAYSQRLAFDGGPTTTSAPLFPACSGAVTPDLYTGYTTASQHHVLPQVEGGVHPDVGLVTLTISGNDMLFPRLVVHCFEHDRCLDERFAPPQATAPAPPTNEDDVNEGNVGAASRLAFPPAQPLRTWVAAAAQSVNERVDQLYGQLRASYPQARIVVIGYPYLFPAGSPPFVPNDCASILRRFSQSEREEIRRLAERYNTMLYARAVQHGLEFVSPEAAWDGHEPCGSRGQYTNSIKFILTPNIVDGGSFHPNHDGQAALAALVACYLNANPAGAPDPFVGGSAHPLTIPALPAAADLGLVDPPGSFASPVPCGG